MRRILIAALAFLLCGQCLAGFGIFQVNGTPPAISFTPAWQPMLLGDGGNAQGVHVMPSGTIFAHTDTYNNFLYVPSGSCTIGGATKAAPCWQPMATTNSINSSLWTALQGSLNVGGGDITECQGNTNVFYMNYNGFVWVSTNRGGTWLKTSQATNTPVNAGPLQTAWLGCDPADTNGDRIYLNTQSGGLFTSTTGTSGGGWSHVTAVASSNTTSCNGQPCGGSIVFDPTSSVVGGVTQKFWVSSDGIGIYQTTNGNPASLALINSAGMPTRTESLAADKFGQLWSAPGYTVSGATISQYASGAWSTKTVGGSNNFMAILFNPTCSTACAVVGNNQVIVIFGSGQLSASLDNGGTWSSGTTVNTPTSAAPQAPWLGPANQTSGSGIYGMNVNGGAIDSAGNVWLPGGISTWTTPNPISGCPGACTRASTTTWAANSIGIEQLVVNQIIAPPGNSPLTSVWDKGVLYSPNPDAFSSVQYSQNAALNAINGSWSLDYALQTLPVVGGTAGNFITAELVQEPASSVDGGTTWVKWPNVPTGNFLGGIVAASTTTNWCAVPGNSGGAQGQIWCTTNGGATAWVQATVPGTPEFIFNNNLQHTFPLTADKQTAGVMYAVDTALNVYKSSNANTGSPSFSLVAATPFDGANGNHKIQAVPGNAGHLLYTGNPNALGHLWKSTNGLGTGWAICAGAPSMVNIAAFGFGAVKPGKTFPMIYTIAQNPNGSDYQVWASDDECATFALLNVPSSQQKFPLGSFDYPTWITGDLNVYGRVYYGFIGSGDAYIDTQDACPWVNFSNIKPTQALTGASVTLTAQHSGIVPVSGVNFYIDGTQIGSTQTGAGPYSVLFNASGQTVGAHTLKVQASGNGCTLGGTGNSFSIPITTSFLMEHDLMPVANDNALMRQSQAA